MDDKTEMSAAYKTVIAGFGNLEPEFASALGLLLEYAAEMVEDLRVENARLAEANEKLERDAELRFHEMRHGE